MGGCCCAPRGAESVRIPAYNYHPQQIEGHGSLSSIHGTSSAASTTGLLVNTNLETSIADTSRVPRVQLPDAGTDQQTIPENLQNSTNKTDHIQTEDSHVNSGVDGSFGGSDTSETLEKPETNLKADDLIDSANLSEDESTKLKETVASDIDVDIEEDDCPICLEEYEVDNPRIVTKCVHHFHLSCILEWMERSDTCPICDQVLTTILLTNIMHRLGSATKMAPLSER